MEIDVYAQEADLYARCTNEEGTRMVYIKAVFNQALWRWEVTESQVPRLDSKGLTLNSLMQEIAEDLEWLLSCPDGPGAR